MKKSNLLKGAAAVALGLAAVGCSHEIGGGEADLRAQIIAEYNEMFIKTFGRPASNQDWGFGTSGTRSAVAPWNETHAKPHAWESGLNFASEDEVKNMTGVVNVKDHVTQSGYDGTKGSVYYIPNDFEGELNMNWMGCDAPFTFYNFGNVTSFHSMNVNDGGNITIYNAGKMVFNTNPAIKCAAVYNRASETELGIFEIQENDAYAKIDNLYNGGNLVLGAGSYKDWQGKTVYNQANVKVNGVIYSTGTGIVELPGGADWMAGCHIDGIVYTDAYLKIQNSTDKYMCGVVSRNEGDNIDIVDAAGGLTTSYIKTNKLSLNGASVYLTNNGYVNANQIHVEGSSCNSQLGSEYEAIVVEPVTGAKAFVETTSFDLPNVKIFGNHLGAGVYTKFETVRYYAEGYENSVVTKTAAEYFERYPNEASKLAPETLGGVSECGGKWGAQTPNEGNTGNGEPNWVFQNRVFAEDLSVNDASDFDFNDVVFDVYHSTTTNQTKIQLLAAGGTLPITVAGFDVHAQFGEGTTTMINTGDVTGLNIVNDKTAEPILITGIVAVKDIAIVVSKNNTLLTLDATQGKPAAKFAVPAQIKWCAERSNIEDVYTNFGAWVENPSTPWYTAADYGDGVK